MKKNVCATHGELNEANAYVCVSPTSKSGIRLRCKLCCNERRIKQYYLNQEDNIKKSAIWKKENREHANAWERNNRLIDLPLTRAKEATRKKGINIDRYNQMLEEQDNKCAICKEQETRRVRSLDEISRLSIDHCHSSLVIRGLLCHNCNTGIGKFKDSIDLLQSAINYLKKHQH